MGVTATLLAMRDGWFPPTINVDVPGVEYAELFADLRPDQLASAHALAEPLQRLLLQDGE